MVDIRALIFAGSVSFLTLIVYNGIHEGTHAYYVIKDGKELKDICILGYDRIEKDGQEKTAIGWVTANESWYEPCRWWMFGHVGDCS